MKLMIASDIHGSLKYCRQLVEKYNEEKCDKLILLGDVLYHGPRNDLPEEYNPKGVIALLNAMSEEILCVRGNCEAEGLNLLFRSIANLRKSLNPKLRIDGILLTMVDSRTNFAKAIITALRESVGMNIRVFDTQIPHSVRAAECPLEGKSIFAHDKRGKVAAAYEALTKEVTELAQRSKHRSRTDGVR